jgi:hypothetical protein
MGAFLNCRGKWPWEPAGKLKISGAVLIIKLISYRAGADGCTAEIHQVGTVCLGGFYEKHLFHDTISHSAKTAQVSLETRESFLATSGLFQRLVT